MRDMEIGIQRVSCAQRGLDRRLEKIVAHPLGGATILTLANITTLIRIFVSPIFLFIYLEYEVLGISYTVLPYLLLFFLIALELSDALDGYLARKYDQVTDLGKLLDPMADSIYHISVFLAFTQPPVSLPLVIVFLFIYRDSVISTLRTVCALRGVTLAARPSGKLKAACQGLSGIAISALLIPHSVGSITTQTLTQISTWIALATALYALYSGAEYLVANFRYVRRSIIRKKRESTFESVAS